MSLHAGQHFGIVNMPPSSGRTRGHLGEGYNTMSLGERILVSLSGLFPPANLERYRDENSYSQWQFGDAAAVFESFYKRVVRFDNRVILDLGCGPGGKTVFYSLQGPRAAIGVDVDGPKIQSAQWFARDKGVCDRCSFLVADACELPLQSCSVDVAISDDGFGHFMRPARVLAEAQRVLRPEGVFLITLATYWTISGPHLHNFVRVPWPHLFFSDKTMVAATRAVAAQQAAKILDKHLAEKHKAQAEREIYYFENFINKITLRRWKRLLTASPDWELLCFHKYTGGGKSRFARPFMNLPIFDELFGGIFCALKKAIGRRIQMKDFSERRLAILPNLAGSSPGRRVWSSGSGEDSLCPNSARRSERGGTPRRLPCAAL